MQQVGNDSPLEQQNNESTNIKPEADNDNQHNVEDISAIQLPLDSLTDLHADWDDIDETEDNDKETIVHERSPDVSPRISTNCKSKERFPDLGIGGIQRLKCTQDILSEMKRHSKPHINE
jgi:hypothetical protein